MLREQMAEKIRESAKRLLSEGRVDCVMGYEEGTVPLKDRPFFAHTPEEADRLTWSPFCTGNLAGFLVRRPKGEKGKVAIVAQGCVSRNIVGLIKENQLTREDVHVLGVGCLGMVSRHKVEARFPGKTIAAARAEGDDLAVSGPGFEERFPIKEVLRDNCLTCQMRNPVIEDEMVSDRVDDRMGGDIDKLAEPWEKLDAAGRQAAFEAAIQSCIRCYACRDACPLCYCNVCFVDESMPQWCGKTQDEADVGTFHLLRAFHCAGRCTDCGACESACPAGIKMRVFTSKIEKDIRDLYDYRPGMNLTAEPPLNVYRPNDPEGFIK